MTYESVCACVCLCAYFEISIFSVGVFVCGRFEISIFYVNVCL